MDPITIIVTALALGAGAGLKPTAEQAIKDAYTGFKTLVLRKYGDIGLDALEKKPGSQAKKDSIAEDLADANADQDTELVQQAQAVIRVVEEHAPETKATIKLKVEDVEAAANFKISDLAARGEQADIDVSVSEARAGGNFEISNLTADAGQDTDPNP